MANNDDATPRSVRSSRGTDAEKALRARVAELEAEAASRATLGRKPKRPRSEDGELIEDVCQHLNIRRATLADRLGVDPAILSRANAPTKRTRIPLAEHHRAALRAMLKGPKNGEI